MESQPNTRFAMKLTNTAPLWTIACALFSPLAAHAALEPLDEPSLEELTKTEISSVSRRNQSLANVPAAAFVISAEDIRRSGAHALPDVLRMVPGIEVAQVDNGRYAVSARGFNGRFANTLQVLVDGRSIYSPFFSGVMWEHDPVALEDIERIEVIRGPGAAMWGANAVNGVINIITKHSAAQTGGMLAPTVGSNGFGQLYGRYGHRVDDNTSWKLSFQGRHIAPSTQFASREESADRLQNGQINFRFDRNLGGGSDLSVWAGATQMKLGDLAPLDPEITMAGLVLLPARLMQADDSQTITGRYRWLSGAVESTLQVSASRTHIEMEGWFQEDRQTYDLDYQGRHALGAHDLLWGLSHRTNSDEVASAADVLTLSYMAFTQRSTGIFFHDDWTLVPERLQFGLGARYEYSNLGGSTFAPNATLMWTPSRMHAAWIKLAQAPRVPARGEQHVSAMTTIASIPVFPYQIALRAVAPQERLDPEKMASLELGYRLQASPAFNLNLTVYRQRYSDQVSGKKEGFPYLVFGTYLVQDVARGNYASGWIDGAELAADWLVTPNWRLQLSLTATRLDMNGAETPEAAAANAVQEKRTPRHYGSLRSQWNLGANRQLDAWLRGSAGFELVDAPYTGLVKVPGYVTLDLRYAWRMNKDLELSITGRNLIGARRHEYVSDYVPSIPIEIKPSLLMGLRLGF